MHIAFTVDLEPDCPPYLDGWRGMEAGAPRLLELLEAEGVRATFFTTGETAERFPDLVRTLVAAGHELGCHGQTHRRFTEMECGQAEDEIRRSAGTLRAFAPVTAFRAPYLDLPEAFLPLLEAHGFDLDASRGRYKPSHWLRRRRPSSLRRLEASTTSSVLRLPAAIRDPLLRRLRSPVVLFVHPWEFVDLSAERLRWDCRAGTGPRALEAVRDVLRLFRALGAHFVLASEAAEAAAPARPPHRLSPSAARRSAP